MENVSISVYDILNTGGIRYRILYVKQNRVIGCRMDTTKLLLDYLMISDIQNNLAVGDWKIEEDEKSPLVDPTHLSEEAREKFNTYKQCMVDVTKTYGPTFLGLEGKGRKPEANEIMKKYGLSSFVFWKICRLYLQSGCKDSSLIDKRSAGFAMKPTQYEYSKRVGRPTEYGTPNKVILNDEIKGYFDEAIKEYKKGRQTTYKGAYEDMLHKHYMVQKTEENSIVWELFPVDQIPTMRQFYNYAEKKLSLEEKDAIRTSKQEQRNNKRLLLSDAMKGIQGPGDTVEVDALEADISLVSERDSEQTIGRGILYLMIDVWTRTILAMSVGFENNSVLACTDLLLNLADDKVEYAKKYGITFDKHLWPSNIIPRRMRVDRGADFRSDKLENILNGLGIERMLAPAATGSLKGIVEQEFRQIQFNQNNIVENNGLIEKRHDSKHHREAKLTISDFTAMCINFVINHNQKYQQYYKLNKKMQDAHVEPIPIKLWEYGCKQYGAPRPIADKKQFYWNLLTPAKASLNREGIRWKNLYYLNTRDRQLMHEMYVQQRKVKKIDVRYDPRDIGCLYYMRDGELMKAPLNPDKFGNDGFEGMTYKEYMNYQHTKKEMDAKGKEHNRKVSIGERAANQQIVDSVQPVHYSDTDNMREEREKEKQEHNRQNSITSRIDDEQQNNKPIPEETKPQEEKTENPNTAFNQTYDEDDIIAAFDKAIKDFNARH